MVKRYLPYCFVIVLVLIIILQCKSYNIKNTTYRDNLKALTDTVTFYKNKLGTQTATIHALELEKNELDQVVLQKNKQLKTLAAEFSAVKSVVKYSAETKIDTIVTVFKKPLTALPKFNITGKREDKWCSFNYRITNDSLTLSSFIMHTDATIITGYKRKWFLGKENLTTDVTFSNPHIGVTKLTSAQVTIKQPLYKKWYVWLGIGIIGGIIIK